MPNVDQGRRNLLRLIGTGAAAFVVPHRMLHTSPGPGPKIGLQLYTVRKSIETDFEGTMRKVADIGFFGVESYTLPGNVELSRAARMFKDLELEVLGMHTELPVGAKRESVLRMADLYNCSRVIYPGGPETEKYKSVDGIGHMVDVYNETADFLAGRGLQFGLHNHWLEFEKTDGYYPFYYLLKHLDERIFFEIDTYWAKTAGQDPAKVVGDFGKRAPLLHIKDGPAIKGEAGSKQVPAGEGVMNFPAIAKAGGKNIQWMIIEFDEYEKNIFDGITQSYSFLVKNRLGAGRI